MIKGGEASKQMTSDALKSVRKNQKNEKIRNLANNPGTEGEGSRKEKISTRKNHKNRSYQNLNHMHQVTEGVAFLKKKKEEKKKSKSQSI